MSAQAILEQVRGRLALADELTRMPKTRHRAWMERHTAWQELWRAAYLEGHDELKGVFIELFPPTAELEQHLQKTLVALRSEDEDAVQAAAAELERRSRRVLSMPLEMEVADPRLVLEVCGLLGEEWIRSMKGPAGDATVQSLVGYLGALACRMSYENSKEIYAALERVWSCASPKVRPAVATAMCYLAEPRKWSPIIEAFEAPRAKLAPLVMALNFAGEPPEDLVPRLSAAMLVCAKRSKRPQDWVPALGKCAGPEAIDFLERLRTKKVSSVTLEKIEKAIANLRRRFSR